MKQFVRKVKDNVLLFSEGERLVRDATSNEPWGASSTLMHQIADLTCQRDHAESVTNMLWKRLTDVTYPRHVLKACLLVEFLLRNGSERFVHDMKQRRRRFEALSKFSDYTENPEVGADVRAKTLQILALLDDDTRRNEERVTAARTKAKIHGMGNASNIPPRIQSSSSQRRDDSANTSGLDNGSENNSPKQHNVIRQASDDIFDQKLFKDDSKSPTKNKPTPENDNGSFGFDDDPLDEDEMPNLKAKDAQKSSKKGAESGKLNSEKKKKKSKNSDSSNDQKSKDKKKSKKGNKPKDSEDGGGLDPPSGQEDMGDFVGANQAITEITKQIDHMTFEANFDLMGDSMKKSQQQSAPKQQQPSKQQQASFDFFSSLETQNISPNNDTQNEWFASKQATPNPDKGANASNDFMDDFQSAPSVPPKLTPNQSPDDIWASLTNIDSLTAPKVAHPSVPKTTPSAMGQPQQYDPFIGMMGANPQMGNPSQVPFNNGAYYKAYPQDVQQTQYQQQQQYGAPYGQSPMNPMMMPTSMYQQPFANPAQQTGFAAPLMPTQPQQQRAPQTNLNIPDAFASFGAMSK